MWQRPFAGQGEKTKNKALGTFAVPRAFVFTYFKPYQGFKLYQISDFYFMCIFDQIGVKLSLVSLAFTGQEISGIGFLHQDFPDVLFIA